MEVDIALKISFGVNNHILSSRFSPKEPSTITPQSLNHAHGSQRSQPMTLF